MEPKLEKVSRLEKQADMINYKIEYQRQKQEREIDNFLDCELDKFRKRNIACKSKNSER